MRSVRTGTTPALNAHLPPHLREVCDILARGLLRLRSRTAAELSPEAAQTGGTGDIHLHCTAHQRRHANPKRKGDA